MKTLYFALRYLAASLPLFIENTTAQCKIDYSNYQVVLEENFDNISDINDLTNEWEFFPSGEPNFGWGDCLVPDCPQNTWGEYYLPSQVSLQPGGILRLSAHKLNIPLDLTLSDNITVRHPVFVSGVIMTKKGWHYDPPMAWPYDDTGWTYGMFEIRCKLPKEDCFPSFWMYGGDGWEFFEYGGGAETRIFSTTQHQTQLPLPTPNGCSNYYKKTSWDDLADNFHTWTGVWTPDQITVFFDGRELRTISSDFMPTNFRNHELIANLAMRQWNVGDTYMDIDYIKVFKPVGNDYDLSFKSSSEYMPHNIFQHGTTSFVKVSNVHGAITVNSNDQNQIFYRGTNDRIYEANLIDGSWVVTIIPYNYPPVLPNMLADGDLVYNPVFNYIMYKGKDSRIQFFNKYGNSWWHWFINDNWATTEYDISPDEGSLAVFNSNGKIVYKGKDNKIHFFSWDNGLSDWVHSWLKYTYGMTEDPLADYVKGDVVVEQSTGRILYKGFDDRLQCFTRQENGLYIHSWIDSPANPATFKVSSSPGSIISTPLEGIFYKGMDNKLHNYKWNGNGFTHLLIPHNYGNCNGYPEADYIKGNLSYNVINKKVYYIGFDGRIQFFEKYPTQWVHWWTDDYFNTPDYSSYDNLTIANSLSKASMYVQNLDGKIIYSRNNGDLAYFIWEPCEVLNPPCQSSSQEATVLGLLANKTTEIKDSNIQPVQIEYDNPEDKFNVFPNPFDNMISINSNNYKGEINSVEIHDNAGHIVYKFEGKTTFLDINAAGIESGIYVLRIISNNKRINHSIVKM